MKKIFDIQFVKTHSGCYNNEKLAETFRENGKTCFESEKCNVTLKEIFNSNIPNKDKYWWLCVNSLTREENQQLAIIALDVFSKEFSKQFPEDAEYCKNYMKTVKKYVNDKAIWDELRDSYYAEKNKMTALRRWVFSYYYYGGVGAYGGFGSFIHPAYLLYYIGQGLKIEEKILKIVLKFCKL